MAQLTPSPTEKKRKKSDALRPPSAAPRDNPINPPLPPPPPRYQSALIELILTAGDIQCRWK